MALSSDCHCYLGVSCPSVAACVRESAVPRGVRGPSLDSCPLAARPHSCLRPTAGQEAACCPTSSGRDPSPVVGGSGPPGLMSRGCQPWTPRALFCQAHLEACPEGTSGTYTHGARAAPWYMAQVTQLVAALKFQGARSKVVISHGQQPSDLFSKPALFFT